MKLQNVSRTLAMLVAVGAICLAARPAMAAPVVTSTDEARGISVPPSFAQLMKMKPMEVMHMMDTDEKGVVTKEQFMKFFETLFDKMDKAHDGAITKDAWMEGWAKRNR